MHLEWMHLQEYKFIFDMLICMGVKLFLRRKYQEDGKNCIMKNLLIDTFHETVRIR